MSSDIFRRVGRGGLGNFYSKKDVEEVEKKAEAETDVEAQKPADAAAIRSTGPVHSRAGRGGAGNFHEPAAVNGDAAEEAERTTAAVSASATKPRAGLSGRGGAGNWTDTAAQAAQAAGDEKRRQDDLEAKILHDVEAGLAMPRRTYHQHEREMEK